MPARIIPVIHYITHEAAIQNATLAQRLGCAGVFLIQMSALDSYMVPAAKKIKATWPDMRVGMNRLNSGPAEAVKLNIEDGMDMTWSDHALVRSIRTSPYADEVTEALKAKEGHQFFAAVAFKGQPHEDNPPLAARRTAERGWVVTTSGPRTGVPPEPQKIIDMKAAIGERPLAIASGITPENVSDYLGHVDYILVSTGISTMMGDMFVPEKLEALMANVAGR